MISGVGDRHGSDLVLLWLWRRPPATAPIRPLALEPPYATGATLEKAKRQKKKRKKVKDRCQTKYTYKLPPWKYWLYRTKQKIKLEAQ